MATVLNLVLSIISLAVALVPVWFFMLIKYLLAPQGFWQNLVLYGLGFWFLAAFQIFFLIFWIIVLICIWGKK